MNSGKEIVLTASIAAAVLSPGLASANDRNTLVLRPDNTLVLPAPGSVARSAARPAARAPATSSPIGGTDSLSTGSISSAGDGAGAQATPAMTQLHIRWCVDTYPNYRVADNSFQPDDGGRQPCVAPFD